MIPAAGLGFMMSTNLTGVQVDLPEKDVAAATAAFVFMRSYGGIFGVSIPAAIFNARFAEKSYLITDPAVRQQLGNGEAYAFTTVALVGSFAPETQQQVREVFGVAAFVACQYCVCEDRAAACLRGEGNLVANDY